jgi:hypothetical protein
MPRLPVHLAAAEALAALTRLDSTPVAPTEADLQRLASEWAFSPSWDIETQRAWVKKYVPSIRIDGEGIRGVTLRLPVQGSRGDLATPWVWTGSPLGPQTWAALLGGHDLTRAGRRLARGDVMASDVARMLGITPNRLAYLLRVGRLPMPSAKNGTRKVWTPADLDTTQKMWADSRGHRESEPGLPVDGSCPIPAPR